MHWMGNGLLVWIAACVCTVARAAEPASVSDSGTCRKVTASIREWVAEKAPVATAAQQREFGLFLPEKFSPAQPLVVIIHGLDMDRADFDDLTSRLTTAGKQVGFFGYPSDQPIADDVKLFTEKMRLFHGDHPDTPIRVVGYSMGALVARGYIEGTNYAGGVDRFIMLSPPNHGSRWARLTVLAKLREQTVEAFSDPDWKISWVVTSGLCEAGHDLLPQSVFIQSLNVLPRRDGIRYTIAEGDESFLQRYTADAIEAPAHWIPRCAMRCTCFSSLRASLLKESNKLRQGGCDGDGPVSLDSAALPGVTDIVRLHADHHTMIKPDGDHPPVAMDLLCDRLK